MIILIIRAIALAISVYLFHKDLREDDVPSSSETIIVNPLPIEEIKPILLEDDEFERKLQHLFEKWDREYREYKELSKREYQEGGMVMLICNKDVFIPAGTPDEIMDEYFEIHNRWVRTYLLTGKLNKVEYSDEYYDNML